MRRVWQMVREVWRGAPSVTPMEWLVLSLILAILLAIIGPKLRWFGPVVG